MMSQPLNPPKKSKLADRQARSAPSTDERTAAQPGEHRASKEDSITTDELIGTLTNRTSSSGVTASLHSAAYDREYPSLHGQGHTETSQNHLATTKSSSAMPSASSSSSAPEAPSKPLFAGSLSEDLSWHLTCSQSVPLFNGFGGIPKIEPASKAPPQPFTALTASGGKKYQPPTMRGVAGPSSTPKPFMDPSVSPGLSSQPHLTLLTPQSSPALDSTLPLPGSPPGILTAPRPIAADSTSTVLPSSAFRVFGTSPTTSEPVKAAAGGATTRPPSLSFPRANAAPPSGKTAGMTSPISMISSFLSSTTDSTENPAAGAAPAVPSPAVPLTNGTTVSNLLKLKLAGNNAPKIVVKPGQDAKAPGPAPGPASVPFGSAPPPAFTLHTPGDFPPLGSQPVRTSASIPAGQPLQPIPQPMHQPPHLLTLSSHIPVQHPQLHHGPHSIQSHSQHVPLQTRGFFAATRPDGLKPMSTMNPNAPPFRPSGSDGTMPQPHSDYDGGWDDEATWVKEPEYCHSMQAANHHHWSGFNPNAPPFISKHAVRSTVSDPGEDDIHQGLMQHPMHFGSRQPLHLYTSDSDTQLYDGSRCKIRQPCLVCGQESTLECSTCAQIRKRLGVPLRTFFCSTEHQMQVWKQHHEEVHLQHPLSGVPSLKKQKQQAVVKPAADTQSFKAGDSLSGSSSDGTAEPEGGPDGEVLGCVESWNGSVSPAEESPGDDGAVKVNGRVLTPSASSELSPTSAHEPDAPGDMSFTGYCTPHFYPSLGTATASGEGDTDVDCPPMAESELESIGNSILNDLDDMMGAAPFAVAGQAVHGIELTNRGVREDGDPDSGTGVS